MILTILVLTIAICALIIMAIPLLIIESSAWAVIIGFFIMLVILLCMIWDGLTMIVHGINKLYKWVRK